MNRRKSPMTGWFRSYADKLDNPKVQRLSDALYRTWDSLLCVASRYDGVLPPLADLAFLLRRSPAATAKLIDALMQADLLVNTERGIEPHDWNEWQYKSDTSKERMRRHRQRQRDVTSAVTVTHSESEAESESDREAPSGLPDSDRQTSSPIAARASQEGSAHDCERRIVIAIKRIAS